MDSDDQVNSMFRTVLKTQKNMYHFERTLSNLFGIKKQKAQKRVIGDREVEDVSGMFDDASGVSLITEGSKMSWKIGRLLS